MKHYCDYIPLDLADRLKEKGMPIKEDIYLEDDGCWEKTIKSPSYAEVFDWLIEKGIITSIYPFITEIRMIAYKLIIKTVRNNKVTTHCTNVYSTWHEAANAAIEKTLTLI